MSTTQNISSFLKHSTCLIFQKNGVSIFCGSKTGDFVQSQPELRNQYDDDPLLDPYLKAALPSEVYNETKNDFVRFGESVSKEIHGYHMDVGNYEPTLQQYSAWGERMDKISMHPSWHNLHDVAAQEKLISIPYANTFGVWSRTIQAVKLFLFAPSSGLYSCPLAMTDGAASILKSRHEQLFKNAFAKLTSNDANSFWTSGQWMTEKKGGSDVGQATQTQAIKQTDGSYKLYGFKWFTSATDANMSLTLARVQNEDGKVEEGTRGLTMFYLETRNSDGSLNGIKIEKLKKKLGTRQMPTAELILEGSRAYKVSEEGRGIASIAPMLTITRIHNAISAVSTMRRLLNLSRDFSFKRIAFGNNLNQNPLHVQTLARLEVEQQGAFMLLMKVCHLLGLQENALSDDSDEMLLRILTPLLKLYTGKQCVAVCSELLESFGGHGYLEDTGLPAYLRDAQVLSIWEGTTNVLCTDVLRSVIKTNGEALKVLLTNCAMNLTTNSEVCGEIKDPRKLILQAIEALSLFVKESSGKSEVFMQSAARDFSYSLARTYIASLLYKNAANDPSSLRSKQAVILWCTQHDLVPVKSYLNNKNVYSELDYKRNHFLVYGC